MRYFIIILVILFSCNNRKKIEKIPTTNSVMNKKTEKKQEKRIKFYKNNQFIKTFDFNIPPLSTDIDNISNKNTGKYNISKSLKNQILQKDNYYKLINYSNIKDDKFYKIFTVFGNYDYYTNIILVTTKADSLVDYRVIASILGDGGEKTEIKTIFLDSISFKTTIVDKHLTKNGKYRILNIKTEKFKIGSNGKIDKI